MVGGQRSGTFGSMRSWLSVSVMVCLVLAACGDSSEQINARLDDTPVSTGLVSPTLAPATSLVDAAAEPAAPDANVDSEEPAFDSGAFLTDAIERASAMSSWSQRLSLSVDGRTLASDLHFDGSVFYMVADFDGQIVELWTSGDAEVSATEFGSPFVSVSPTGRSVFESSVPSVMLDSMRHASFEHVVDAGDVVSLVFSCPDRSQMNPGFSLSQACGPDSGTELTFHFTAASRDLVAWEATGGFELWPGRWSPFTAQGDLRTFDAGQELVFPEDANDAGHRCLADELGLDPDAYGLIRLAIRDTTTVENQDLFTGCGYETWPSGSDLNS